MSFARDVAVDIHNESSSPIMKVITSTIAYASASSKYRNAGFWVTRTTMDEYNRTRQVLREDVSALFGQVSKKVRTTTEKS